MTRQLATPSDCCIVYLAGGMRSGWGEKVKAALPYLIYIDPSKQPRSKTEVEYTEWDLHGVAKCDIVFGYIEADNPSGAGLAVEFGYGSALGKHLFYTQDPGFPFDRYFGMVRAVSDYTFTDLDTAIDQLAELTGMTRQDQPVNAPA